MSVRIGERYRDRYEVLAHLGEGAFAHVWRARDESGTEVALKVLKDEYQREREVVERFQREVFAVSSIDSPHVVALSDFGLSGDDFYIVMELVEGPTLREVMRRPWTAEEIWVVVGQIAHALAAAHKQDIVHRDLKPENVVLVERPGAAWQAKVLDFGFAKLASLQRQLGLEELTQKGHLFGTPQYLSPEQIRGQPLDGRADLFALGVIAYEMIAGQRPWDGRSPGAIMSAVLEHPPGQVVTAHPSLMPRLAQVNGFLKRALARERDARPADAEAFFQALGAALLGESAPTLRGAQVQRSLDQASSQSVKLKVSRRRDDATEIDTSDADADDLTVPFNVRPGGDTAREKAMGSGWFPIIDETTPVPRVPPPPSMRPPSKAVGRFVFVLVALALLGTAFWLAITLG